MDPDRAHQLIMGVATEALEGAEAVTLELCEEDGRLLVAVTSPQPPRPRPFAEGGEGAHGGLGLYVARELARRQGGDLDVHADRGGARYVLSLPLASRADV